MKEALGGNCSKACQRQKKKKNRKKRACFRDGTTGGSEGAEVARTRATLSFSSSVFKGWVCFRDRVNTASDGAEDEPLAHPSFFCSLNGCNGYIIFLYQNWAIYLLNSYSLEKDEHIFASLSLFCAQAFFLHYTEEHPALPTNLQRYDGEYKKRLYIVDRLCLH